jgi:hypothetical protein
MPSHSASHVTTRDEPERVLRRIGRHGWGPAISLTFQRCHVPTPESSKKRNSYMRLAFSPGPQSHFCLTSVPNSERSWRLAASILATELSRSDKFGERRRSRRKCRTNAREGGSYGANSRARKRPRRESGPFIRGQLAITEFPGTQWSQTKNGPCATVRTVRSLPA